MLQILPIFGNSIIHLIMLCISPIMHAPIALHLFLSSIPFICTFTHTFSCCMVPDLLQPFFYTRSPTLSGP